MIFGLKQRPVDIRYLLNDDERTPISMIGQKMLPILQQGEQFMGESMDIVHKINLTDGESVLVGQSCVAIADWLKKVSYSNKLLIPRYVKGGMPEFATEAARAYFTDKKEAVFGSFQTLLAETDRWLSQINNDLQELASLIQTTTACNGELSEDDIHLFPLLRGLSIVKGVIYPPKVDEYRKNMSKLCAVPLYNIS